MKKPTAVLTALICIAALSGCTDVKITENSSIADPPAAEVSEIENNEKEDNSSQTENDEKTDIDKTETETEATKESQTESESPTEEDSQQSDDNGRLLYEEANLEQIASEQYEKSCEMQWKYFMSCPYELNYDDTVGEGNNIAYCLIDADLEDILADYSTVFASYIIENGEQTRGDRCAEKLQERYHVGQYGVYCSDSGRGKKKSYDYTEFEFISYDDNILKLNAISYYTKPSGKTEIKEAPFTITQIDGQWKTWDFTLPY